MIYSSQYRHITLCARTTDGRPFLLAAGQHEPDYPYRGAVWDAVIMLLGDRRLQRASQQLSGLELPMLVPDEERELAMALELKPAAVNPGEQPATRGLSLVEASLLLRFGGPLVTRLGPQAALGFSLGLVPGMRYAAMVVDANPRTHPWIRVDGEDIQLDPLTVVGQIEWGDLIGWDVRALDFGYHYRCALDPNGDLVRVDLKSYSLRADSWATRLADLVIDSTACLSLVGARHRRVPSPAPDIAPRGTELAVISRERLVSAPLRLGPADVDRALCRFRDAAGHEYYGLEEICRPAMGPGFPLPEA